MRTRRSPVRGAWWPELLCLLCPLPWHAGDMNERPQRTRKPSEKGLLWRGAMEEEAAGLEAGQVGQMGAPGGLGVF